MIRKWITKHILRVHGLAVCKMCDNLAHIDQGICDYCEYELDMMRKEAYGWGRMYEE